jgi:hypothetical protein
MVFESLIRRTMLAVAMLAGFGGSAAGQSTEPVSRSEARVMSVAAPDPDSPFYIEREEAKAASAKAGREGLGMYVPKPPHPPVTAQVKSFFAGMFGFVKPGRKASSLPPILLTVEPSDFSLAERSEIQVTVKVSNAEKETVTIPYPSEQRIEILTRDPSGNLIGRWSEDRSFESMEGFVAINPEEYVSYSERIPTARMKAGATYTIEASLASPAGYAASVSVTPRP